MWHWWTWISGHGGVGLIVGLDGFRGLFQLMILWFHSLGFAGGGLESQHSAAGCVIIFCTTGNQQGVEASFTTPVRFSRAYLSVPGSWPQARWALEAWKYGQEPSTFMTAISTSLAMICIVEVLCLTQPKELCSRPPPGSTHNHPKFKFCVWEQCPSAPWALAACLMLRLSVVWVGRYYLGGQSSGREGKQKTGRLCRAVPVSGV